MGQPERPMGARAFGVMMWVAGESAVEAVCFFVIDPFHFIAGMQRVPRASFVRVDNRSLGDARADE